MRVSVTGANGFVGSALVPALNNLGHEVRGLSRADISLDAPPANWVSRLAGCGCVVHLAARAHVTKDSARNPLDEFRRVNCEGALRVAAAARDSGVERFIFMSSIGVNGNATTDTSFTGQSPPNPQSDYAIAKYEAEAGLRKLFESTPTKLFIIRPPLVYGPGAPGNWALLLRLVKSQLPLPFESIENHRSLVSIDNLVSLVATCIAHPNEVTEPLLVSDPVPISTPELIRRIAGAMGRRANLFPCSPPLLRRIAWLIGKEDQIAKLVDSLVIDDSRTVELLDWRPRETLEETLRRCA